MPDPPELRNLQNATADVDEFLFHDELDEFLAGMRDCLFEGLRGRQNSVTSYTAAVLALARLAADFAGQVRLLAPEAECWQEIVDGIWSSPSVGESLAATQSEAGADRLREHLAQLPFPHFEANPDDPSTLIRVSEDGTRTIGRFVDGEFRPVE